jgi:hypothetical protein
LSGLNSKAFYTLQNICTVKNHKIARPNHAHFSLWNNRLLAKAKAQEQLKCHLGYDRGWR